MAKKVLHVPQHKAVSSTPATPDLGFSKIYAKNDGYWYRLDELGNEVQFADSANVPNLQAVTFAGNTTTFDINLDGSNLVLLNGGYSSTLEANPTQNNILTLPDATGTLLYGSGTPGAIPVFSTINGLGDSYLSQSASSVILDQTKAFDVTSGGTLNIGTANASIINIGWSGVTVNIKGNTLYEQVTELLVEDSLFTINKGGGAGSASSSGFEIEEAGNPTGYFKTGTSRNSWRIKPPATNEAELLFTSLTADRAYTLPNASGTIALTSDLGSYVPTTRTISTNSPLSGGGNLSSNLTLSISQSSGSTDGYLSSTDWTTFNNKQDALVSGVNIKTVVTKSLVGSGNVTIDINDLSDVDTVSTPPTNGQTLLWNSTLSQWLPGTIISGIQSLNGLTATTQTFATGTTGTDFNISSSTSTHTFNLPDASATNRGALTTTDWTTFNNKVSTTRSISTTSPLTGGGNLGSDLTLAITQSSGSADGYLSSTDWTTFNNKQGALTLTTTGTTGPSTLIGNTLNIPNYTTTFPQAAKIYVDSEYGVNSPGRGGLSDPYLTVEYALSSVTNTGSFTGNTTNNSSTISNISDVHNASLKVGQYATGSGIPFGTVIIAKGNEGSNLNTITLSKAATSTSASVTLTWWTVYEVILNGTFNATSSWTKQGMYINSGTAIIYFSNLTVFDGSTVYSIPHKILGKGSFFGTHISSRFINMSGTQSSGFNLYVSFGTIETISTAYTISTSFGTNENYVQIEGGFINARFGYVATITGYSNRISFDSYGLLGGIVMVNGTTSTTSAINTISGAHTTPAAVTVLNAGYYTNSTGSYRGSTSWGGYSVHKGGKLNGTTHSISGSNIEFNSWSNGSLSISGSSVLTFTSGWGGNITITAPSTVCIYGNCGNGNTTIPAGSTVINYGTMSGGDPGISGAGKFINHGVFSPSYIKFAGTIENHGTITTLDIEFTGNGWAVTNFGQIYLSAYGIMMQTYTGKFINRGRIESVGAFTNNTAMILLNQTGTTFENYGEIISNDTDITDALITKTAGTLKLFPGSRLKVSNSKSPIRCTANTSASKDIYMFHCITNCDGSTYGLGFAFDGSSFVPNDLAGGLKYENTAY